MLNYLKKLLFQGLLVLIPLSLLYVTIRELAELMIGFATPVAEWLPEGWVREGDWLPMAPIILILLCTLLVGFIWSSPMTRGAASWLEHRTLNLIPLYRMIKSLVTAFLDMESKQSFLPALLELPDGMFEPVYIIEEHGQNMLVIMKPWTPTPFAGSIMVVPREKVSKVNASLDEFSLALTHFGLGISDALDKHR